MPSIWELRNKHLSLAYDFIDHGVPCFAAKPVPEGWDGRSEFFLPAGWPYIDADRKHVDSWRPGWAVCAITGIKFDVMDFDPRNGSDTAKAVLVDNDLMPTSYGRVETPSGGEHLYIRRTYTRKFTPWKGVDIQSGDMGGNGRGFIYIPPTRRKGRQYQLTQRVDWDGLGSPVDDNHMKFIRLIAKYYKKSVSEQQALDFITNGHHPPELSDAEHNYLIKTRLMPILEAIKDASIGYRDTLLNKYSYTLGGLVTGSGLPEELAFTTLSGTVQRFWTDITPHEYDTWILPKIKRGIEQGKKFPLVVFGGDSESDGAE